MTTPSRRDVPAVPAAWRRPWIRATLAAAVVMTAGDALILQVRKSFFTGGFLTDTYTRSVPEAAAFLAVSLLADAAAAGLLAALALWLTARLRLTTRARFTVALLGGLAPLLTADVLLYRLLAYLGDTFDFSLMFDLTGRKPSEILAVSAAHLVAPALLAVSGGVVACGLVWAVNRGDARARMHAGRGLGVYALVLAATTCVTVAVVRAGNDTLDDGLQRKPSGQIFGRITAAVTDFDRDGFGIGGRISDPAPFDGHVYPYALDVPGNGIDEDATAGDLPAGGRPYTEPQQPVGPWTRTPNIVLIVLESFRADAFGRTVNGKPVTPVLDTLARRGICVPEAFSHNGYTAQSRFHVFSGSLVDLRDHQTLVDDFKAHGYEVAYFSGQDDSFGGAAYSVGFDRADVFYDARQDRDKRYSTFATAGSLAVPFTRVQERLAAYLGARTSTKPLFLYVNFHDTHYPYHHAGMRPLVSDVTFGAAQIEPSNAGPLHDMYYNAAANVDAAIGATIEAATKQLGASPAVIVLSDHGESLFDEGFLGHGYALNDVQTRIPLVAVGLPLRVEEPFGQSDLRDLIGRALSSTDDGPPTAMVVPDKRVFQYLGKIDAPRQIGFAYATSRAIYDFRTRRARIATGAWTAPDELSAGNADIFRDLVHTWERMMLARAAAGRRDRE